MRITPQSEEAEKGFLGSILQAPALVLNEWGERIQPHHFYLAPHQTIYRALLAMQETRIAIDIITLPQFLTDRGENEQAGGASYITSLLTFVPTAANAAFYADTLQRKWIRRVIIERCTDIIRQAYEEAAEDEHELLDKAQAEITALTIENNPVNALRHVKEGAFAVLDKFDLAHANRGKQAIHGLATGINDLDRMTAGLKKQQLVVVGARPSHGKTALAMNLAANMAVTNNVPVAVFSLEMSYEEICERLICSVSGASLQALRLTGFIKEEDLKKLPDHVSTVGASPLWIDDSAALTIGSLKARVRRAKARFGVQVVIVDYLQLMKSPSRRAMEARWLEITEISGGLKAIAKELDLTVICCAQLNREAEGREFGKPKLADLRESGAIEQDADLVVLLWRPERHIENPNQRDRLAKILKIKDADGRPLWKEREKPDAEKTVFNADQIHDRDQQLKAFAALIVAKQRNGPVGEIRLRFEGDITKFQNVTEKMYSNNPNERQQLPEDDW